MFKEECRRSPLRAAIQVAPPLFPEGLDLFRHQPQLAAIRIAQSLIGQIALLVHSLVHEVDQAGGRHQHRKQQQTQGHPLAAIRARTAELESSRHSHCIRKESRIGWKRGRNFSRSSVGRCTRMAALVDGLCTKTPYSLDCWPAVPTPAVQLSAGRPPRIRLLKPPRRWKFDWRFASV